MFGIILFTLLGAAAAQPTNYSSGSISPAVSQCMQQMNGQLPYYVPEGFNFSGNIRRYYISAEIDTWNYGKSTL